METKAPGARRHGLPLRGPQDRRSYHRDDDPRERYSRLAFSAFQVRCDLPTERERSRAQTRPAAAHRRSIRRTDGGDPERREPAEDGLRKMACRRATAPFAE